MTAVRPEPSGTRDGTALLALDGITVRFGGITALDDVSLAVGAHEVLGVIGPNGAGKTTLFNVACGFERPAAGRITWKDEALTGLRPNHLAGLGIGRTLQGLGLFDRMPVLGNVMVGADRHARRGFWSGLLGLPASAREEDALRRRSLEALDRLGIADTAPRLPGSLPYAVRKKVALARALVAEPELLLLDEPASGLSSDEMAELADLVRGLTADMAVVLVEHHMDLVMAVCDTVAVLDFGRLIARGTPDDVRNDPAVVAAYLGDAVGEEGA